MFDIYPRHGHRTPQQIAEDSGGSFEPARKPRSGKPDGSGDRRAGEAGRAGFDDARDHRASDD
jgi:hypothetical protein